MRRSLRQSRRCRHLRRSGRRLGRSGAGLSDRRGGTRGRRRHACRSFVSTDIELPGNGSGLRQGNVAVLIDRNQRHATGADTRCRTGIDEWRTSRRTQVVIGTVNESRQQRLIIGLQRCQRLVRHGAGAGKNIILDQDRFGHGAAHQDEITPRAVIIDEGIVDHIQILARVGGAFGTVGHQVAVAVIGRLLHHVADDVRGAGIRQIDFIAGLAKAAAGKAVVGNRVELGARLQVMADVGIMRIVVAEGQAVDVADIEVV